MASHDLPIEMVNLILSRLPAKSLLRFRCVHKSWRDLISSPQFIKQFKDDKLHEHVLIQDELVYSLHRIIGSHGIMVTQTRIPLPFQTVRTFGYSNGLVCISTSYDEFNVHLWNPSIRISKPVPQPHLTICCSDMKLAFCFVPRINDYRLLRMPGSECVDGKSDIYSLRTNSWKLIESTPPDYRTIVYTFCDLKNGVVYFMALLEEIIITFDMADEVFTTISVRDVVEFDLNGHQTLYPVIFGTSLFLLHTEEGHIDEDQHIHMDRVDVWERTMHDDGTESWSRKHTIDDCFYPVGFLKNGEMVCRHGYQDPLITSYDPRISGKLKSLPIARISRYPDLVTYFVETLMFLDDPR